MTIFKRSLLATLTFSVLGSLATQDLVAMKRKIDIGLENHEAMSDEKLQELRERIENMCNSYLDTAYNSDLAKLCITPGLDLCDWTFCRILNDAIRHKDLEVIQILFNTPSISPDVFASQFEYHESYGCHAFFHALLNPRLTILKMLLNHPCTTADVVNRAIDQAIHDLPVCKLLLNDPRITIEGINKALSQAYNPDVIRRLITQDGVTAEAVNKSLQYCVDSGSRNHNPKTFRILLAHDGITPDTINSALVRLCYWTNEESREIRKLLLVDHRLTDEGIKKAFKTYAKYRLRQGEGQIEIQDCIATGKIDEALLHAITYNKSELIELLLLDNRISEEGIDIALVYAAAKGNREAFDLLRADQRVTAFLPLGYLMNFSNDVQTRIMSNLNPREQQNLFDALNQ